VQNTRQHTQNRQNDINEEVLAMPTCKKAQWAAEKLQKSDLECSWVVFFLLFEYFATFCFWQQGWPSVISSALSSDWVRHRVLNRALHQEKHLF
jgi:hypothetical protein